MLRVLRKADVILNTVVDIVTSALCRWETFPSENRVNLMTLRTRWGLYMESLCHHSDIGH